MRTNLTGSLLVSALCLGLGGSAHAGKGASRPSTPDRESGDDLDSSSGPDGTIRPVGAPASEPAAEPAASGEAAVPTDEGADAGAAATAAPDSTGHERFKAGSDESIYIVQRRAYSKKGRFELTPVVFTALNPKFVGYLGVGGSAAYHFRENLAIELMTSFYNKAFYSGLVYEVYNYEQLTPEEVDLKQMRYFGAVSLQLSALYGKLEFYGWLVDYDFYVTGGLGLATTVEPCQPGRGDCPASDPNAPAQRDTGRDLQTPSDSGDARKITGNLGGGMRVFFSDWFGLRIDVRDIVYSDRKVESAQQGAVGQVTTDIRNNVMLLLGVSFMI